MTTGQDNGRIAIIGGGFSGIVTAWRLARSASFRGRILLLEGTRPLGPAYGTDSPWHVLNTPAGKMSALPEAPEDFLRFATRRIGARPAEAYLPRRLYGDYLATLRDEAIAHGVICRATSARSIAPGTTRGLRIDCDDGVVRCVERAVLAVGAGAPSVPGPLAGLVGAPGFFADPWAAEASEPPADRGAVALIGAGQTAIDVALDLVRRGHRGPITALSRRGLLPQCREPHVAARAAIDIEGMPTESAVAVQRWWRDQIAAVGNAQTAHAALRPHSAACWQRLAPAVRARLLRHARPQWEVGRHRLAPVVAERLETIRRSGQFVVHKGRLQSGHATRDGLMLRWRCRGRAEHVASHAFARVINCTGFGGLAGATASPLLAQLLDDGWVRAGAHGLGIETADDRLDLLGALRRGRYWESTAVPELAQYCRATVEAIEQRMARPATRRAMSRCVTVAVSAQ